MQEQTKDALRRALQAAALPFAEDEPLAPHTTFRIGGPAAFWCAPCDAEQLRSTLACCKQAGVRSYFLGNGSNTLFADEGFDGAVIDLRALSGRVHAQPQADAVCLTAGAGPYAGAPLRRSPAARPDRAGVCLRHPWHGGGRGVYERRRLRR